MTTLEVKAFRTEGVFSLVYQLDSLYNNQSYKITDIF